MIVFRYCLVLLCICINGCIYPEPVTTGGVPVCLLSTGVLVWVPPSKNTDGSVLTDLAGFRIYMVETSSMIGSVVDVRDSTQVSIPLKTLVGSASIGKQYVFSMTSYDMNGLESGRSVGYSCVVR